MAFGGGQFWRYTVWIYRKKAQVWIRTHLSHALAVFLAVLVLVRESPELYELVESGQRPSGFQWLVLFVTISTLVAALWEHFGNKLSSSPQEIRFVNGMRDLLFGLEKFSHGVDREQDVNARLGTFVEGFLELSRYTLCGEKEVDAAFMQKDPAKAALILKKSSKGAKYPANLEIPLDAEPHHGPAAVAFQETCLAYLPKMKRKETWPFSLIEGTGGKQWYEPKLPVTGWVDAKKPEEQSFESVLCVPVAVYHQNAEKQRFGVLNFSTCARDPFVDRDFLMAECFASVLGQACATAQKEIVKA
jgi:hypothetical protein